MHMSRFWLMFFYWFLCWNFLFDCCQYTGLLFQRSFLQIYTIYYAIFFYNPKNWRLHFFLTMCKFFPYVVHCYMYFFFSNQAINIVIEKSSDRAAQMMVKYLKSVAESVIVTPDQINKVTKMCMFYSAAFLP